METKKLKFGSSVTEIFLIIVISGFLFIGLFSFLVSNAADSRVVIPERYNTTYNAFINAQNDTETVANDIRTKLDNIEEAEGTLQVAWNGFRGMLAIFKAPLVIINYGLNLWDVAKSSVDGVPDIVMTTIGICILIILVFALVSFFVGRDKI